MAGLGLSDIIWLIGESRERPLHVGSLMLFELPVGVTPADLRAEMRSADHPPQPPFDQRLARPYGRAGRFNWVPDEVDLDYHLRHVALPDPGRIRELLAYVSQQHGSLLDRHRPLWEAVLIEGVEGDGVALYTKVHHAMLDGMAAMKQLTGSLSTDPSDRGMPPPWAANRPRRRRADGGGSGGLSNPFALASRAVTSVVGESVRATATVGRLGAQIARGSTGSAEVVPYRAPRSMFNQRIASARRVVAQSYDLGRLKGVATANGATVNDVILAVCGGALRAYLLQHDALPRDPLVAMVPVSIRPRDAPDDTSSRGNAVSMMLATLGTDEESPLARLEQVKASMSAGKARLAGMTQIQLVEYAALLLGPLGAGQMLRVSGERRPLFNVIISNVPGPREQLHWNGATMTGMYPLSAIADGYALNITLISYAGSLEVGITADRAALPRIQRLIDHLEDELVALEAA